MQRNGPFTSDDINLEIENRRNTMDTSKTRIQGLITRILRPLFFRLRDHQESRRISRSIQNRFPDLVMNETSIIIDLGLNRGRFSLAVARSGARIIGVEPNPHVFRQSIKTLRKWKNIEFLQAAITDVAGTKDLYFHKDYKVDPIGYSISSSTNPEKFNVNKAFSKSVVGLPLDVLLSSVDSVKLLKIDIEGGEIELVESLIRNYSKIEYLLMELHGTKIPQFDEMDRLKDFIKLNNLGNRWDLTWE